MASGFQYLGTTEDDRKVLMEALRTLRDELQQAVHEVEKSDIPNKESALGILRASLRETDRVTEKVQNGPYASYARVLAETEGESDTSVGNA